MIDIGIKCFVINGECISPVSATILFSFPLIVSILAIVGIVVKVSNKKQDAFRSESEVEN